MNSSKEVLTREQLATVVFETPIKSGTEARERLRLITQAREQKNLAAMSYEDQQHEIVRLGRIKLRSEDVNKRTLLLELDTANRAFMATRLAGLALYRASNDGVRTIGSDHTPDDWQARHLVNRPNRGEQMVAIREQQLADKMNRASAEIEKTTRRMTSRDAKPNLGRSNKKRKLERVESLHTSQGNERLINLEALLFRPTRIAQHP